MIFLKQYLITFTFVLISVWIMPAATDPNPLKLSILCSVLYETGQPNKNGDDHERELKDIVDRYPETIQYGNSLQEKLKFHKDNTKTTKVARIEADIALTSMRQRAMEPTCCVTNECVNGSTEKLSVLSENKSEVTDEELKTIEGKAFVLNEINVYLKATERKIIKYETINNGLLPALIVYKHDEYDKEGALKGKACFIKLIIDAIAKEANNDAIKALKDNIKTKEDINKVLHNITKQFVDYINNFGKIRLCPSTDDFCTAKTVLGDYVEFYKSIFNINLLT